MTARTFTLAELERMLEVSPGKRVQFHPSYCPEAVGTDHRHWDTSHDLSVIRPDGTRVKLAQYTHASEAALSQEAPDLVTALHAALVREQEHDAEAAKLREALEGILECGIEWSARVDAYDIARAALSQIEAPKGDKPTA